MRKFAVLVCGFVAACNYDTGECFLRDEGGAGVGGGVITPTGAGGFGEVPPKPQEATEPPPPECLIVPQGPCYEKCLTDYDAAAAECSKIENETQRKTCQDSAYVTYKVCRDACQKVEDCKEECKKKCDKIHDDCHADCTKNNPTSQCHDDCNQEYGQCLHACDKECK